MLERQKSPSQGLVLSWMPLPRCCSADFSCYTPCCSYEMVSAQPPLPWNSCTKYTRVWKAASFSAPAAAGTVLWTQGSTQETSINKITMRSKSYPATAWHQTDPITHPRLPNTTQTLTAAMHPNGFHRDGKGQTLSGFTSDADAGWSVPARWNHFNHFELALLMRF